MRQVTHTVLVTAEVLQRIKALPAPAGSLFAALLTFFRDTYFETFEMKDPPLHDPVAMAYVIAPEMFAGKRVHVHVDCSASVCAGRTVCNGAAVRRCLI